MLYEEARVYLDSVSKYGSVLGLDSIKKFVGRVGKSTKRADFYTYRRYQWKGVYSRIFVYNLDGSGISDREIYLSYRNRIFGKISD